MRRFTSIRRSGFTLPEVLIATSVFSIMAAAIFGVSIAVQKNYRACRHQMRSQSEQMRVLDYMALDLRRALTVSTGDNQLTLTIPDYYTSSGTPRDPVISSGRVVYGDAAQPVTVSYYKQGNTIFRESGGERLAIATDVQSFELNFTTLSSVVDVSVNFDPRFQFTSTPGGYREGTSKFISTLLRNKLN